MVYSFWGVILRINKVEGAEYPAPVDLRRR
jgi:hypothetical protein